MIDPQLRLRQICLVAYDLEWTSGVLCAAFDAPVVFRDPRMASGGNLTNTHIRLGDSFLETVCPTDKAWADGTTQTRLLERNGDCGYMAIVQVPDVAVASRAMAEQVQVIVRIRPLNEKEKKQSTLPVVSASSTKNEVTVIRGSGARQSHPGEP